MLDLTKALLHSQCVLHPDNRATYSVQGIVVCGACYLQYRAEYDHGSNTQLVSRPFLQRLIKASVEANFPEDKVLTTGGGGGKVAAHAKEEAIKVQTSDLSA